MSSPIEKCVPALRKYYGKVPWLHSHPFFWTSANGPQKTANRWVKAHWYTNAYLAISYLAFLVYRTVEAYNYPSQTLDQQLYLLLMSVLHAFETFYSTSTLIKYDGFIQFQRSHLKLVREGMTIKKSLQITLSFLKLDGQDYVFAGQRQVLENELHDLDSGTGGIMVNIFKVLICSIYYSVCTLAFGIFALNVVNSSSPEFASSLFLRYSSSGPVYNFTVVLASSLFHCYLTLCAAPALTIWSGHVFFFAFFVMDALEVQM